MSTAPKPSQGVVLTNAQVWAALIPWIIVCAVLLIRGMGWFKALVNPIGVSVMTLIVGLVFLRDTRGVDITTGSGVAIQGRSAG